MSRFRQIEIWISKFLSQASAPRAGDPLLLIDERAGHRAGRVAEHENGEARNFLRLEQPTERLLRGGLVEPALAKPERDALHLAFARRIGPADIDAIDADAIEAMGVRGVLGQRRQRALA